MTPTFNQCDAPSLLAVPLAFLHTVVKLSQPLGLKLSEPPRIALESQVDMEHPGVWAHLLLNPSESQRGRAKAGVNAGAVRYMQSQP